MPGRENKPKLNPVTWTNALYQVKAIKKTSGCSRKCSSLKKTQSMFWAQVQARSIMPGSSFNFPGFCIYPVGRLNPTSWFLRFNFLSIQLIPSGSASHLPPAFLIWTSSITIKPPPVCISLPVTNWSSCPSCWYSSTQPGNCDAPGKTQGDRPAHSPPGSRSEPVSTRAQPPAHLCRTPALCKSASQTERPGRQQTKIGGPEATQAFMTRGEVTVEVKNSSTSREWSRVTNQEDKEPGDQLNLTLLLIYWRRDEQ